MLDKVRFSNSPELPCAPYQPEPSPLTCSLTLPSIHTHTHTNTQTSLPCGAGEEGRIEWQYLYPEGQDLVPDWVLGLGLHLCLELGTSHRGVSASLPPPPSTGLTFHPFWPSAQMEHKVDLWSKDTWTTSRQLQLQSFVHTPGSRFLIFVFK